jgi:hypothetical protein
MLNQESFASSCPHNFSPLLPPSARLLLNAVPQCNNSGWREYIVRMLCRRSASLMRTTRGSFTIPSNIIRKLSTCKSHSIPLIPVGHAGRNKKKWSHKWFSIIANYQICISKEAQNTIHFKSYRRMGTDLKYHSAKTWKHGYQLLC